MSSQLPADPPLDPFFELSMQPMCVLAADLGLVRVNAAWSRLLGDGDAGRTPQLLGRIHEADREPTVRALRDLLAAPATATVEFRAVRVDDGSIVWLSLRAATLPGLPFIYGVAADLTQSKVGAAAGTFPESFYHQILDVMDDIVFIKGPRSQLLWGNKALLDYYGMTNEQLRGIVDAPFNEPDYTQQYVRDDIHVYETGTRLDIPEEPLTRFDGEVHVVHTVKHPLRDADGVVIGVFGVSHDITEQRRREKGMRLLEQAIGAASEAIVVADATVPGTPVAYVNSSAARLLGVPPAEALGRPITALLGQVVEPAVREQLLRALAERREEFVEFQVPGPDGAARWSRVMITPNCDSDGELMSFTVAHVDVTAERLRRDQALALGEQQSVIERQQQAITAMSTPILEIWESVLTMPLIGVIDGERATCIMESLLREICERRASFNIIDLTGVDIIDTSTANHLLNLVRAAELLGSTSLLSGISPAASTTMVSLGIDVGRLKTFGSLRSALGFVLKAKGVSIGVGPAAAKPAR